MNLRTIVLCFFSFLLGAVLFAAAEPGTKITAAHASVSSDDTRASDREAIKAHIDKIFQAYMHRDCDTIRSTHAQNWIGFTSRATSILRGLDAYMNSSALNCVNNTPNLGGISDYKVTEIDYVFYDNVALVPYIADVTYGTSS